jgi:hypothetical protein
MNRFRNTVVMLTAAGMLSMGATQIVQAQTPLALSLALFGLGLPPLARAEEPRVITFDVPGAGTRAC